MLTGSQAARFNTAPCPRGYSMEHAELAIELAAGYGLVLDEWQANFVRAWLRTDKDGLWCSSTWAISVSRQNGKNGGLEVVELYLMVALGMKILHTSHLLGSARKAFKRLMHFFGRQTNDPNALFPELNALVVEIRKTNGQEAIELSNGAVIELGARTGGAGRGSSFDVLVVDEAQEYEEDEQEALEPTTSASPSGDPVTIYMGTPPRDISERGAPFVRVRNAAVTGADKRSAYVEHSPVGDVDRMDEATLRAFVQDRSNWAAAIPALGGRVKVRTVETEVAKWSPRSFARERLNMWPTPREGGQPAFPERKWSATGIDEVPADWPVAAYGVDMNPARDLVSIGVAAFADEGMTHLELAADAPFAEAGTQALVEWLWERAKRTKPVVIDGLSPARDVLEVPLKNKGMKVFILGATEWSQACAMTKEAVDQGTVSHFVEQVPLTHSMLHTVLEPLKNRPGSFKFAPATVDMELCRTVAVTCAFYGSKKFKFRPSGVKKQRGAVLV